MPSFRVVTYNFLSGGSRQRSGHWPRVLRGLGADLVCAQECRPPERVPTDDAVLWKSAGSRRWGSAIYARAARLAPLEIPSHAGWVVGGELEAAGWLGESRVRVFSIHGPAGRRGYIATMHEILDGLAPYRRGAELILAGDFNVAVGHRPPGDPLQLSRGERAILDRLTGEFALISCWQTAHPGRRLAQTLRWSTNPATRYHCDGIFVPRAWSERLVACRVVRGARWQALSDHNPVAAEFATA
ncbi:MAG TPA: endonuclease/exonuclease/phosphatase family protein [Candidatus Polarisedimenticolaceae bacterium]|nr:endonuclease/exonuclease/phosphatase family protein [Candidatus Polarisedimenticolaceae bacterium]